MTKHKILVVDDEESLCEILQFNLEVEGYEVDTAYSAEQALGMHPERYSLILLDVMMGETSGFKMARQLKSRPETAGVPIIFCTARDTEDDTVAGLNIGADDYIAKPFGMMELMARIRAMTRTQTGQVSSRITFGNITLDQATFELSSPTGSFRLANKEYQMMELFLRNPRQIIPTERFLERIWGYDSEVEVSVVWVYISYLRKKLSALQADVEIRASRNLGYSLEVRT